MVTHLRDITTTETYCLRDRVLGEALTETKSEVTCSACCEKMADRLVVSPLMPLRADERPVRQRTDADMLNLLAKARAQGVRQLEVRPDGSFVALMDPAGPEPKPYRPGIDPKPPTPEEEAAQREADLYTRHAR